MNSNKFNNISSKTGLPPIVSIKKRREGLNKEKKKEYLKEYNAIYKKNMKEGHKEHISIRPKKKKSKEEYNKYVREYMRKRFGKNKDYLKFIKNMKYIFYNAQELFT